MREIKFRAKSECRGETWLYGYIRHYCHNPRTEKWTIYDPETRMETDIYPETIGQFTGLYDEKGVEIYEGDIVMFWGRPASIEINQIGYAVRPSRISYPIHLDKEGCEVIGNVHDNPKLLKGD